MMPRNTNPHGTIFGGVILSYLDQAGAIAARREVVRAGGKPPFVVTVAMNRVEFKQPVHVGDVVRFLTRSGALGRTSITIQVSVEVERGTEVLQVTEAEVVYVGVEGGASASAAGAASWLMSAQQGQHVRDGDLLQTLHHRSAPASVNFAAGMMADEAHRDALHAARLRRLHARYRVLHHQTARRRECPAFRRNQEHLRIGFAALVSSMPTTASRYEAMPVSCKMRSRLAARRAGPNRLVALRLGASLPAAVARRPIVRRPSRPRRGRALLCGRRICAISCSPKRLPKR